MSTEEMTTDEDQQESLREALERGAEEQGAVEDTEAEEVEAVEEVAEPAEPPLEPIENWPADAKERFQALAELEGGREYQQFLVDQYKSMQGDYTKKTQAAAEERRQFEGTLSEYRQIQQAFQPIAGHWQAQGMSMAQGAAQLAYYSQELAKNPAGTIMRLAQEYNVDLTQALQEQPYVDPTVRSLQEQIQQQNAAIQQTEQAMYQQRLSGAHATIDAFRNATDDAGNPAHPYFDQVEETMGQLVEKGLAQNLEDAYTKAVAWSPDIQKEIAAKQQQASLQQRQAQTEKVKKAASKVSTRTSDAPAEDEGLRATIVRNAQALKSA